MWVRISEVCHDATKYTYYENRTFIFIANKRFPVIKMISCFFVQLNKRCFQYGITSIVSDWYFCRVFECEYGFPSFVVMRPRYAKTYFPIEKWPSLMNIGYMYRFGWYCCAWIQIAAWYDCADSSVQWTYAHSRKHTGSRVWTTMQRASGFGTHNIHIAITTSFHGYNDNFEHFAVVRGICMFQSTLCESPQFVCDGKGIHNAFTAVAVVSCICALWSPTDFTILWRKTW